MNDLRVVNLSTYTSPEIVEKSNKEWVSYGADNDYFSYLIDRYNGSPTNNAIINGISEMIYGKGLDALNSNKKPEAYAKMKTLFHKDCVRKLCYDLKLMGQCAMQVIYSKDRKSIAQVEHIPVENLRAEKCNGFQKNDFSFKDYNRNLQSHLIGKWIAKCSHIARKLYDNKMDHFKAAREVFTIKPLN